MGNTVPERFVSWFKKSTTPTKSLAAKRPLLRISELTFDQFSFALQEEILIIARRFPFIQRRLTETTVTRDWAALVRAINGIVEKDADFDFWYRWIVADIYKAAYGEEYNPQQMRILVA